MQGTSDARSQPKSDNLVLAVVTILLTALALSLGDALIKLVSTDIVLWQIFVIRSVIAIPALVIIVRLQSMTTSLIPRRLGWTVLRSVMLTFMWVAYYAALPHVALAVAAAAFYTLPIFIALFAALFIGDRVGPAGWLSVLLGFVGVLLILKPQAGDFNQYALLPLISAILYALAMILTRTKCRDESPLVLSLCLNASFVVVGLAATVLTMLIDTPGDAEPGTSFLLGQWTAMGRAEWLSMCLLATAVIIGSVGAAIAYQAGPPAIVATFDFTYVAFAAAWGLVFFGEVPGTVKLAGMALVVAAGILAIRR